MQWLSCEASWAKSSQSACAYLFIYKTYTDKHIFTSNKNQTPCHLCHSQNVIAGSFVSNGIRFSPPYEISVLTNQHESNNMGFHDWGYLCQNKQNSVESPVRRSVLKLWVLLMYAWLVWFWGPYLYSFMTQKHLLTWLLVSSLPHHFFCNYINSSTYASQAWLLVPFY